MIHSEKCLIVLNMYGWVTCLNAGWKEIRMKIGWFKEADVKDIMAFHGGGKPQAVCNRRDDLRDAERAYILGKKFGCGIFVHMHVEMLSG